MTDAKDFKPPKSFKQFWDDDTSFSLELEVFKKYIKEYYQVGLNVTYDRTLDSVKYLPANESKEVLAEIVEFAKKQQITVVASSISESLSAMGFVLNEGADRDYRFEVSASILKP
jgi:hypothetical protein